MMLSWEMSRKESASHTEALKVDPECVGCGSSAVYSSPCAMAVYASITVWCVDDILSSMILLYPMSGFVISPWALCLHLHTHSPPISFREVDDRLRSLKSKLQELDSEINAKEVCGQISVSCERLWDLTHTFWEQEMILGEIHSDTQAAPS